MISAALLHKMTIIDLQGTDRVVDQYHGLSDYFGRFSVCWLSKLIFQLIFCNGEKATYQNVSAFLSEAHER